MMFFEFLQKELGVSPRCDFYFMTGRVEIHKVQDEPNVIFVRVANEIIPEEDFVAVDYKPVIECKINGANNHEVENMVKILIANSLWRDPCRGGG